MPCSAGMLRCRIGCGHREVVRDYRAERERQETNMEEATGLHRSEVEEYKEHNDMITFKKWLTARRRPA